jgi:diguanylate cyclase (GGDEF)-like protein/PAS domain S-box-containing protein
LPLVGRIGVRPQLSLVALVAIFPLLALMIFGVVKSRQLILEAAATRALDLARLAAERQDDSFKDARNVLKVIRRLPQVTAASPQDCRAAMRAIGADYPQFTSLGVVDATGMASCINIADKPLPFRDMDVFRAAMAAGPSGFVVGKFMIGPITGKPIVAAAAPLVSAGKDEPPPGIAFVSLDLNRAAEQARDFAVRTDATLSLIDSRASTILFRSPDQQNLAGKTFDGSPMIEAMHARPAGGSVETADVDGTPRIVGFAPLDVGDGAGLMVAVGLSRAQVLAAADHRLMLGIAVAIVTAILAAAAAWLVGDRVQLAAIRSLAATAKKLGAGDLAARAEMPAWQALEFRDLAEALGEMASGIGRAQANLAASERQLRLLAENSTDMILLVREDGKRLYASPACRALLGFEPEEMLQISSNDAIHPDDRHFLADRQSWSGNEAATWTLRLRRKDGGYLWVESVSRAIAVEAGEPLRRVVVVRDIETRLAAERRLKDSETRYRLLAEYSTDMVFQLDGDLVRRYVSPACREILGYEPEQLVGAQPLAMVHPDDVERLGAICQFVIRGVTQRATIVYRIRHRDGRWIWVEAQLRTLNDPESGAPSGMLIGALRDISQRKAAEDQLEEVNRRLEALAGQDGLTGLANRRTFDDALAREHRRAGRDRTRLAMIMIDVDRFKAFNDRYGHPAGDDALRRVSRAIESTLRRPGDVAARYGGEEFAVLLPGADESAGAIIADRIRRAVLDLAIEHDESPAGVVTISAGVASVAPGAFDSSLAALVADADRALYRAKANGRNAIVYASALADAISDGRSSAA